MISVCIVTSNLVHLYNWHLQHWLMLWKITLVKIIIIKIIIIIIIIIIIKYNVCTASVSIYVGRYTYSDACSIKR